MILYDRVYVFRSLIINHKKKVAEMAVSTFTTKKAVILIIIGVVCLVLGIVVLIISNTIYPSDVTVGEALLTVGLCLLTLGILLDGISVYRLLKK